VKKITETRRSKHTIWFFMSNSFIICQYNSLGIKYITSQNILSYIVQILFTLHWKIVIIPFENRENFSKQVYFSPLSTLRQNCINR
jgi:cellulose synthase/poly-beta-1,6-N-acetylglucosamine synthase-like glycosyltransferase